MRRPVRREALLDLGNGSKAVRQRASNSRGHAVWRGREIDSAPPATLRIGLPQVRGPVAPLLDRRPNGQTCSAACSAAGGMRRDRVQNLGGHGAEYASPMPMHWRSAFTNARLEDRAWSLARDHDALFEPTVLPASRSR